MYRLLVAVVAALATAAFVSTAQGDDSAPAAHWYDRLMPWKSKAAAKVKKNEEKTKDATPKRAPEDPQIAEKAKWMRRIAVCDKLRDIAVMTRDDTLRSKADELDQKAWDVYQRRSQKFTAIARTRPEGQTLENRLGARTTTPEQLLPSTTKTAESQAAIREVRP